MQEGTKKNRLKEVRRFTGLTLDEVARRAGVTTAYVCRLEQGPVEKINDKMRGRLAEALDTPERLLFTDATD